MNYLLCGKENYWQNFFSNNYSKHRSDVTSVSIFKTQLRTYSMYWCLHLIENQTCSNMRYSKTPQKNECRVFTLIQLGLNQFILSGQKYSVSKTDGGPVQKIRKKNLKMCCLSPKFWMLLCSFQRFWWLLKVPKYALFSW